MKDCVGHAEEMRIVKEELFCDNCREFIGKNVYIVIGRGILLGVTETLEEAKKVLNGLNEEKLILWYHDLYQRYIDEQREKQSYWRFLEDLREWYGERWYEKPETESGIEGLRFIWHSRHLKGCMNPVESIERSVDVYQDELNERCRLNWTWTVISKKQLETEGEKEEELPE